MLLFEDGQMPRFLTTSKHRARFSERSGPNVCVSPCGLAKCGQRRRRGAAEGEELAPIYIRAPSCATRFKRLGSLSLIIKNATEEAVQTGKRSACWLCFYARRG